jgi:hypothetical protein
MAALYGSGKRTYPPGQVIHALPCDVDHKALCAQFEGECGDPNFLLKATIDDPGGAPPMS